MTDVIPSKKLNDTESKVFNFDKSGYLPDSEIDKLYQKKLELVTNKTIQDKLFKVSFCDPRKSDIYFDSVESANIGKGIADKLNRMSKSDFLKNDYSWKWIDEMSEGNLFKIINKKVLNKQTGESTNTIKKYYNS